jgi:hypothetical protein
LQSDDGLADKTGRQADAWGFMALGILGLNGISWGWSGRQMQHQLFCFSKSGALQNCTTTQGGIGRYGKTLNQPPESNTGLFCVIQVFFCVMALRKGQGNAMLWLDQVPNEKNFDSNLFINLKNKPTKNEA